MLKIRVMGVAMHFSKELIATRLPMVLAAKINDMLQNSTESKRAGKLIISHFAFTATKNKKNRLTAIEIVSN